MKGRWIVLGAALGFAVALTLAFAHGSGSTMPGGGSGASDQMDMSEMWTTMDAMHDSPAMQQIHEQMPAELRAQCEAMHEQMSQMMQGMSGLSGMGGMSAGMAGMAGGFASHAGHHPTTTGS